MTIFILNMKFNILKIMSNGFFNYDLGFLNELYLLLCKYLKLNYNLVLVLKINFNIT